MRTKAMVLAAVSALATLASTTVATAAPVVVGSPLTAAFTQTRTNYVGTATNTVLPEPGANTTSPVDGAIRRWRFQGSGLHRLRVLHPNGDGTYTGVYTGPQVSGGGSRTVSTDVVVPIRKGDAIGIDDTASADQIGIASVPGASYGYWIPSLANGATAAWTGVLPGAELAVGADVVPAPVVTDVAPASGAPAGGSAVVLRGSDFTEASAVSFGGTPAQSFTVDSDSQITAIAPDGTPGTVDVRVTTPSGTSPVADAARYTRVGPSAPGGPLQLPSLPGTTPAAVSEPRSTGRGIEMEVSCDGPASGFCRLTTRLVVGVIKHHGSSRVVRVANVAKAKKAKRAYRAYLTVGVRKAKIAGGQKAKVRVNLDRRGLALLKAKGRLKLRVVRAYTAPNGARMTLPARQVIIKRR